MERSIKSLSRLQLNVTHSGILDQYRNRSFKNKKGRNWIISIRSITVLEQRARGSSTRFETRFRGGGEAMILFLYRDYNAAKESPQRNAFLSGN